MAIVDYYCNLIIKKNWSLFIFKKKNCTCKIYNILEIKVHLGELKENTLSWLFLNTLKYSYKTIFKSFSLKYCNFIIINVELQIYLNDTVLNRIYI